MNLLLFCILLCIDPNEESLFCRHRKSRLIFLYFFCILLFISHCVNGRLARNGAIKFQNELSPMRERLPRDSILSVAKARTTPWFEGTSMHYRIENSMVPSRAQLQPATRREQLYWPMHTRSQFVPSKQLFASLTRSSLECSHSSGCCSVCLSSYLVYNQSRCAEIALHTISRKICPNKSVKSHIEQINECALALVSIHSEKCADEIWCNCSVHVLFIICLFVIVFFSFFRRCVFG